jgi:hypothetical protein
MQLPRGFIRSEDSGVFSLQLATIRTQAIVLSLLFSVVAVAVDFPRSPPFCHPDVRLLGSPSKTRVKVHKAIQVNGVMGKGTKTLDSGQSIVLHYLPLTQVQDRLGWILIEHVSAFSHNTFK